ncbi:MAG: enhanced intracellular survival protein Eis [Candidatus Odinarchaeota archaeon]
MENHGSAKKIPVEDIEAFIDIYVKAYPAFFLENFSDERKQKMKENFTLIQEKVPAIDIHGLYRDDQLVGGMFFYDYVMNMFSIKVKTAGVGQIAVDLLHKKEHICKEMMAHFLRHYRGKGVFMTILYPFRADFYKKMGYGYSTKMNRYYFKPDSLKRGDSKRNVHYLQKEDLEPLLDCHSRYVDRTHGMTERKAREMMRFLANPNVNMVGCKNGDGSISGYVAFKFVKAKADNFIFNDIEILELIYDNSEALSELCTFLHTQADQVNRIIYCTQDESIHFLLTDARNGTNNLLGDHHVSQETNTQGRGLMYRVTDTENLFKHLSEHDFGQQTCKLKLSVTDTFLQENSNPLVIHFEKGKATLKKEDEHEVEITMDVSEFSSMVMGVISFKKLYQYGLAEISDSSYLEIVNRIFLVGEKPICLADF